MKFITSTPATTRFMWETKILDSSLLLAGIKPQDIYNVYIYDNASSMVVTSRYLSVLTDAGINIKFYKSGLVDLTSKYGLYAAAVKPFGFMSLLKENPSLQSETFMQLDTDVVMLEPLPVIEIGHKQVVGSNTSFYQNLKLVKSHDSGGYDKFIKDLSDIVKISPDDLDSIDNKACGAQIVISNPTVELFEKITEDCYRIKKSMEDNVSGAQSWISEMLASYYNYYAFGYNPTILESLGFSWSSDSMEELNKWSILHDSGISKKSAQKNSLFFKNKYIKGNFPTKNNINFDSLAIDSLGTAYAVLVYNLDDFTRVGLNLGHEPNISARDYIINHLLDMCSEDRLDKVKEYIESTFKKFPTSLSYISN